jgi:hypothetical protein
MEMSLVLHHRRNMLMCTEWYLPPLLPPVQDPTNRLFSHPSSCGIPIYANTPHTTCLNCATPLTLSLNPKIIGTLLDETGSIAAGKLLWSPRAWEQLLGRTPAQLSQMKGEEIRALEQRMGFLRMHLVFGWAESVGRLAVLGMCM